MSEAPPASDLAAWEPFLPSWTQTFISPGSYERYLGGAPRTGQHGFVITSGFQSRTSPY